MFDFIDRIYISDHPDLPQLLKRISTSCPGPSIQSSFRTVSVVCSDWISTLNYGTSVKNPQLIVADEPKLAKLVSEPLAGCVRPIDAHAFWQSHHRMRVMDDEAGKAVNFSTM